MAKQSDLIICHSNYAANILKKRDNPKGKVVVMYHGLYEGVYPAPAPRDKVLKKLGLDPSLPTFCCLGNIRHYKGFDLAADAVRLLDKRVQLIIAGSVHKDYDINSLQNKVLATDGCVLIPKFLSDQDFSDIISACDAVILPYRKITTSGLLLAAWTFEKPVIVSDHPLFRELVQRAEEAVEFFRPGDGLDLAKAISRFLSKDRSLKLQAIKNLKNRYCWKNCIKTVV